MPSSLSSSHQVKSRHCKSVQSFKWEKPIPVICLHKATVKKRKHLSCLRCCKPTSVIWHAVRFNLSSAVNPLKCGKPASLICLHPIKLSRHNRVIRLIHSKPVS